MMTRYPIATAAAFSVAFSLAMHAMHNLVGAPSEPQIKSWPEPPGELQADPQPEPETRAVIAKEGAYGCIDHRDTKRGPNPLFFDAGECTKYSVGERVTIITRGTNVGRFSFVGLSRARRDGVLRAYWIPNLYLEPEAPQ